MHKYTVTIFLKVIALHETHLRCKSAENFKHALMYSFTWLKILGTNCENGNRLGYGDCTTEN